MRRNLLRWATALALFVSLAALCVRDYSPPLPGPLVLDLLLEPGPVGRAEPLVCAGRIGAAQFLFLRHVDNDTVVFGYDNWGEGGPVSPPVKISAGWRHHLVIDLPMLHDARENFSAPSRRLRVVCDGAVVFESDAHFHLRAPSEFFLGVNPIGGTSCDPTLHGQLFRADGREVRGPLAAIFTWREQVTGWFLQRPWQVLALLALVAMIVRSRRRVAELPSALRSAGLALVRHRWFAGATAVCVIVFAWVSTGGTYRLVADESFCNFYDYQAASLLQGRLDVPHDAIGDEAFIYDGKFYGYFGITPALLRLPFAIFDIAFGQLSRVFLLAGYLASLIAAYLILLEVVRLVRGAGARPGRATVLFFTVNTGLGSTLFFLSSRAYIYHEAIMCGAAFALWGCWCALRHLAAPAGRWWIGSLGCGVLSVHARPPVGFFALTFLAVVALALALRAVRVQRPAGVPLRLATLRRPLAVAVLAAAGVLSFNGLSYLKFHTIDGCPLRLNIQYNAKRLAKIDGKQFHLGNIPFAFDAYVLRPNFIIRDRFPYFVFWKPVRNFPAAKMDVIEPVIAFPYAMPGLFALATLGCAAAFTMFRAAREPIAVLWVAALPMSLAMFAAIAVSHRYTADFAPIIICGAAFGIVAIEALPSYARAALGALLAGLTVCAVLATAALTLVQQGEWLWGVPAEAKANYEKLQQRADSFFNVHPNAAP